MPVQLQLYKYLIPGYVNGKQQKKIAIQIVIKHGQTSE
jgi:hypothetical protein